MNLWIGLFRGINVGGHGKLPMKELKSMLSDLGCESISTYIQSGNVVFSHEEARADILEAEICRAVKSNFGFETRVLLLSLAQWKLAVTQNPFPHATSEPASLHLYFLGEEPTKADWDKLAVLKSDREQYQLIDRVFYLHAPDGIGRSRLAAGVEKCLGVAATARNWRTVEKVLVLTE